MNWFIRAICITPVLIGIALLIKNYLVEPYGIGMVRFEIEVQKILRKGDRQI